MNKYLGSISILVLVFGTVFSVAIGGLVIVSLSQYTAANRTESFERALTVAQAGAEYYRWHLAHAPDDFQDGTGAEGPYIHTFQDPYGNTESTFSLSVTPPAEGSTIVTIESEGWLNAYPDIKRKVKARYGIPSLAKFSNLFNANVWFGQGITVHGKIMSNGGIRMDGVNDSTVQSLKETYTCGSETGCSPTQTKPGVWGSGGPQELWEFPVPQVDFNSLIVDFSTMRTAAQNNGTYRGPSGSYGYHVTFNSDSTYTLRRVTNAYNRRGYSVENGCENLYQQIQSQSTIGTYTIADAPIIFLEDDVWVDGVVNGKVTLVAARFPINNYNENIWITDNLTYVAKDGHSNLGLFAQNDIYFGLNIPTNFEVNGALLAQKGHVIRHLYNWWGCSVYSNAVRNSLTFYGSLITNQKSYWNWGTQPVSGFITRTMTYDPNLYFDPPPYFPSQGEYEFISWEEE
ncbi:hypothetical protein C4579_02310 [Candidatus Microgenomates bacterium]|nr:MAG: hypothetical protein C4579_02310 [Candidatus Microgenomates bacterium]